MKKIILVEAVIVLSLVFYSAPIAFAYDSKEQLNLADFENSSFKNNLGGYITLHGTAQSKSGIYNAGVPGYDPANIRNGNASFQLINGKMEEARQGHIKGGGVVFFELNPEGISRDVSKYKYLTFWIKGKRGGEKVQVYFRDLFAPSIMAQKAKDVAVEREWKEVKIDLSELIEIDLTCLNRIGIGIGYNLGNQEGDTVYLDDLAFEI